MDAGDLAALEMICLKRQSVGGRGREGEGGEGWVGGGAGLINWGVIGPLEPPAKGRTLPFGFHVTAPWTPSSTLIQAHFGPFGNAGH